MASESVPQPSPITVIEAARVRHWRAPSSTGRPYHIPYPGQLHDPGTDEQLDWSESIGRALRQLPEGSLVRIVIEHAPQDVAADDYWTLIKPHTYAHAKDAPAEPGEEAARG